jgi:hypothetical protein
MGQMKLRLVSLAAHVERDPLVEAGGGLWDRDGGQLTAQPGQARRPSPLAPTRSERCWMQGFCEQ